MLTEMDGALEQAQQQAAHNRKLIERYPFLLPDHARDQNGEMKQDYDYGYIKLDDMPVGWKLAFGEQMCEEIREALLASGDTEEEGEAALQAYRVWEVKHKYDELCWYDSGGVEEIVHKYQKRSGRTCIGCGSPIDREHDGWSSPFCKRCQSMDELAL